MDKQKNVTSERFSTKAFAVFSMLLLSLSVFSQQQKTLQGTVFDEQGETLPGVSVTVKGMTKGVATDANGAYAINLEGNETLVFSCIGFQTVEKSIRGVTILDVILEEEVTTLNELVVVGYGTQRKKDLTGSVASIKEEAFNQGAIGSNPLQLIEGKVAGLSITRVNGNDPNAGLAVQLRGISSVKGKKDPLVIIDGVAVNDMSAVQILNPDDIASIDVLKDGSAAAIYGTRGTNGVILVTTKKGRQGPAQVNFEATWFTEAISKKLTSLSADQYWQLSTDLDKQIFDKGYNTNWFDELVATPLSQIYTLSVSGGTDYTTYRASANYKNQEGILAVPTDRETLNGRISVSQKSWEGRLTFDLNLAYSNIKAEYTDYAALGQAVIRNPTYPLRNPDGSYFYSGNVSDFDFNPIAKLENKSSGGEFDRIMADLRATLVIIDGLDMSALGAIRRGNDMNRQYVASIDEQLMARGIKGEAQRDASSKTDRTFEGIVHYTKSWDRHHLALMGAYSYQDEVSEGFHARNMNFSTDAYAWNYLREGTYLKQGDADMNSSKSSEKLIASLVRANYNYDEKYLLSLSLRREGSSRFGANHKWGNFPAVSAGWRISNESFMKEIHWLDDLKIRAGYGLTGNQMDVNYLSIARFGTQQYAYHDGQWILTYGPSSNPNADLKWEVKQEANIGFDLSLLKYRIGMVLDIYQRKNKDLLYEVQAAVPGLIHSTIWANVGTMESRGVEVVLHGSPIERKDLKLDLSLNLSANNSKMKSLSNDKYISAANYIEDGYFGAPGIIGNTIRVEAGKRVGNFYGYKYQGLTPDGQWIFEDVDNSGTLNDADKQIIGNGIPKCVLGLTANLTWKNLDATLSLRSALGFDILNAKEMYFANPHTFPTNNLLMSALDKHKNIDDTPKFSDYYLEKGDYLKISNVTIGYRFNTASFQKYISKLRLFASADNLYTFTQYSGIDPELNSAGFETGLDRLSFYPRTITFSLGLSIGF